MTKQHYKPNTHHHVTEQCRIKRIQRVEMHKQRMQTGKDRHQRHRAKGFDRKSPAHTLYRQPVERQVDDEKQQAERA